MKATANKTVYIDLESSSVLNLGGNINRPTGYGSLLMEASSTINFVGTTTQVVPSTKVNDALEDSLYITKMKFNNTSGNSMALSGTLVIMDELELGNGILEFVNDGRLIISDGAMITGGSEMSFVDGPITKIGSTNGKKFTFPVGEGKIYAPLTISEVKSADMEYTVQYFGCPPPIEEYDAPLAQISTLEHWTYSRSKGSDSVDVVLNWMDAVNSGIDDIDFLVVAYSDGVNPWKSLGNGGVISGIGASQAGSVTNAFGCTPPIEEGFLTFGSTINRQSFNGSLPIELYSFEASQDGNSIYLEWKTTAEPDNDYFEI